MGPRAAASVRVVRRTNGYARERSASGRVSRVCAQLLGVLFGTNRPKGSTPACLVSSSAFTYLPVRLLSVFAESLRTGGYLFLETIGGQGGNYAQLPDAGFVKATLGNSFCVQVLQGDSSGSNSQLRSHDKNAGSKGVSQRNRCTQAASGLDIS